MILCVPELEPAKKAFPSLGPQVCDYIEEHLVFGPGDLRGMPARLDDEKRALIHRAYEVYPKGHPLEGRRRFKRVALSLRKGSAKTELAAWIAACELSPTGPVRTVGWRGKQPVGGPVTDPYIPMMAYTEDQSEELAYGALRAILEESQIAHLFDIGLERIVRATGDGKAVAVASAPNTNDGARTTFQHFDETHRLVLPRIKDAHKTMLANIPKRKMADPWSLETTTAFEPGEESVAEATMAYAQSIQEGRKKDATLFFFHRQAATTHDTKTKKGLREAILEASGPVGEWSDIAGIEDQFNDPTQDRTYLTRVWLNQPTRSEDKAFDVEAWGRAKRLEHTIEPGAWVTIGFDGSRSNDATGLVVTEVETGHQTVLGVWERPANAKVWEVPADEVNERVAYAFERWNVWRLYADPPYWESVIAEWQAKYNDGTDLSKARVVKWYTAISNGRKLATAVLAFANAIRDGSLSHDGHEAYARHIANAHKRNAGQLKDDAGVPLWTIQKERADSPRKMDLAMAGVLSWQARQDARALGIGARKVSVYESRGVLTL